MFMRKTWLIFSQTVTVAVGVLFVVTTFRPQWLASLSFRQGLPAPTVFVAQPSGGHAASAERVVLSGFRDAARTAAPTVVSVSASNTAARQNRRSDPWFRYFFGDQESQPQSGVGSGVIVSPEGYVLTNNHVVDRMDDIQIMLTDGRKASAKVIGTDPDTDLAVLKVELDRLPAITFGSSDNLQVGDPVLAIGNPFGVGQTVTSGIVSALGRNQLGINTFENFIQTDAAINPGNSGGALVDGNGNLLGINTAIYSRSGGSMGIGFAIPVSTAKQVLEGIVKDGQVTRGWIGVEPQELNAELIEAFKLKPEAVKAGGVIITGVLQNGPAAQGGIKPGDVITAVNGQPVRSVSQLLTSVAALKPGTPAPLTVLRGNGSVEVEITPGKRERPRVKR